jgi:hypothetical protein
MWMKPISTLLVLTLAGAGVACSDPASGASKEAAPAAVETAQVEGTFNLNIGRTTEESGGLMIDAGSADGSDGLMVGPDSTGGNFATVEGLDVDLGDAAGTVLEEGAANSEDDIVRLPPSK